MLTNAEKDKRIIELYEQGATYREIIREVHKSPGYVSSIIKKYTGELEVKSEADKQQQVEGPTTETKVFNLFEEGKTPVQVATSLNLAAQEVTKLHREYWRLKGQEELDDLYEDIGDDIFQFQRAYELTKDEGYTHTQLIEVANHLEELPLLRGERQRLEQENQSLADQRDRLNESTIIAKQDLSAINVGIKVSREELERLNRQTLEAQKTLVNLNTSHGYQQVLRTAEAAAKNILRQNGAVLVMALRALFQALKDEPKEQLQFLIHGSLTYPMYEPEYGKVPQNHIQLRQAVLLRAAEETYTGLLAKCINSTISSVLNMPSGSGYPPSY